MSTRKVYTRVRLALREDPTNVGFIHVTARIDDHADVNEAFYHILASATRTYGDVFDVTLVDPTLDDQPYAYEGGVHCPCGWSRVLLADETPEQALAKHEGTQVHRSAVEEWLGVDKDETMKGSRCSGCGYHSGYHSENCTGGA